MSHLMTPPIMSHIVTPPVMSHIVTPPIRRHHHSPASVKNTPSGPFALMCRTGMFFRILASSGLARTRFRRISSRRQYSASPAFFPRTPSFLSITFRLDSCAPSVGSSSPLLLRPDMGLAPACLSGRVWTGLPPPTQRSTLSLTRLSCWVKWLIWSRIWADLRQSRCIFSLLRALLIDWMRLRILMSLSRCSCEVAGGLVWKRLRLLLLGGERNLQSDLRRAIFWLMRSFCLATSTDRELNLHWKEYRCRRLACAWLSAHPGSICRRFSQRIWSSLRRCTWQPCRWSQSSPIPGTLITFRFMLFIIADSLTSDPHPPAALLQLPLQLGQVAPQVVVLLAEAGRAVLLLLQLQSQLLDQRLRLGVHLRAGQLHLQLVVLSRERLGLLDQLQPLPLRLPHQLLVAAQPVLQLQHVALPGATAPLPPRLHGLDLPLQLHYHLPHLVAGPLSELRLQDYLLHHRPQPSRQLGLPRLPQQSFYLCQSGPAAGVAAQQVGCPQLGRPCPAEPHLLLGTLGNVLIALDIVALGLQELGGGGLAHLGLQVVELPGEVLDDLVVVVVEAHLRVVQQLVVVGLLGQPRNLGPSLLPLPQGGLPLLPPLRPPHPLLLQPVYLLPQTELLLLQVLHHLLQLLAQPPQLLPLLPQSLHLALPALPVLPQAGELGLESPHPLLLGLVLQHAPAHLLLQVPPHLPQLLPLLLLLRPALQQSLHSLPQLPVLPLQPLRLLNQPAF